MARQRIAGRRSRRATVWTAGVLLAGLLALPLAARPQDDPGFSDLGGNYTLPAGKTHHGNLKLFKATVTIAGKQDGNLWVFGGTLDVSGEVTGNVKFIGNNVTVTGKVAGEVDAKGADCVIAGSVGKDFDAKCGTVEARSGSTIGGDVDVYAGQIGLHGAIDGDLSAQGGQIELSGTVGKDASLEADVIKIDEKAKIAGNLSHQSRVPVPEDVQRMVQGRVEREVRNHVHMEHPRSFVGGFAWWFTSLLLGLLTGFGALALARKPGEAVLAATRGDVLRNLGVGFLAFIVVPVAAVLSCILIVTIPLALAVLLLYALAVYLAKVPVAVAAGRWMFLKLGRSEPSQYVAFAAGTVALYVLFAIPTLGWILWFACAFLGLGAMVLGTRDWRRARRAAAVTPAEPPPAGGASTLPDAMPPYPPPPVPVERPPEES
jgi:hypothetical protein